MTQCDRQVKSCRRSPDLSRGVSLWTATHFVRSDAVRGFFKPQPPPSPWTLSHSEDRRALRNSPRPDAVRWASTRKEADLFSVAPLCRHRAAPRLFRCVSQTHPDRFNRATGVAIRCLLLARSILQLILHRVPHNFDQRRLTTRPKTVQQCDDLDRQTKRDWNCASRVEPLSTAARGAGLFRFWFFLRH